MDGSKTMWHLPETLREFEEAGDDSIVLELINSFQNDTASRCGSLHAAVARLDAATVKAEAHSMRGSARQMGAEALADLCQIIEAGALKMNWPELEGQVDQADECFAEVRSAMSEYVSARRLAG
jgi:histidine phosphotransfer protein HptB